MTIKEKLREIKWMDRRIDSLVRQIEYERERIRTTDYTKDKVQSSNGSDLSDAVAKLDEYVKYLDAKINDIVSKKKELQDLVDELQSPYWDVISIYYFESGNTWEQVAVKMQYSYPQVQWIHGKALRILETRFKEKVNSI